MSEYLAKTYRAMAESLVIDESYFDQDSRFYTLDQTLLAYRHGRMLDMGCGQGSLISRLQSHHDVFGLEWDERALQIARNKGLRADRIDLNDATSLPFDSPFDYIVCSEVCEHLLNPRNVFKLAFQYLNREGIFIVTVPNAVPLFARVALLFGGTVDWLHYPSADTEQTGHIRFYTLRSLSALAQQEGFAILGKRGLSWRMNGALWGRAFYWLSRLRMASNIPKSAMLLDCAFGRLFPTLSPGLMLILQKSSI
jgi:2-polyprenyl-3-methyl-5-hydroxy-6-metoxy-1,4-benzoquinol methylase